MTLEEAIVHAEKVAEENEKEFRLCPYPDQECNGSQDCRCLEDGSGKGCLKCAAEHRQLAKWLRELKERRKQLEIIFCKDCKQFRKWQDIDCHYCETTEFEATEEDFCSWAERRTDEMQ